MPFIHILDENRRPTGWVHINLGSKRNREAQYCPFCAREGIRSLAGALCDGKVARGTCDAPICSHHATHHGKDLDFCPNHKGQVPRTLFDGVAK